VRAQVFQRNEFKRAYMRRREYYGGCASGFKRFLPSSHAQTPAIAAFEAGKVELRNGCAEVVADCGTEAKELLGHHCAHGVQPVITGTSAAVAIAIEAGARRTTAAFEFAAQDVCKVSHALILHRQSRFCRVHFVLNHAAFMANRGVKFVPNLRNPAPLTH
jgi:hypothetical protein